MKYVPLYINDLFPDDSIPFNIYARTRGRKDIILFTKAGVSIPADRMQELADNDNLSFFINPADMSAFKYYYAKHIKVTTPETSEDVVEAVVEGATLSERVLETAEKDSLWGVSIKGAFGAAAVVALIEMYLGMEEISAVIIGAMAAFGMFIAFMILARAEVLAETPPADRPAKKAIHIGDAILCPHCYEPAKPEYTACSFCGGHIIYVKKPGRDIEEKIEDQSAPPASEPKPAAPKAAPARRPEPRPRAVKPTAPAPRAPEPVMPQPAAPGKGMRPGIPTAL